MFSSKKIFCLDKNFIKLIFSTMSSDSEDNLIKLTKTIIPPLLNNKHKGQDGRIGIFGGSLEYSGAPYFAGMSALRTGADLAHIFCTKDASTPIKSFSPEIIVHPLLDHSNALEEIEPWLNRLHVILIGPGLGREENIFNNVSTIIAFCRKLNKPLVIDADGLFLICQKPDLVKNYPNLVLTPNSMEFTRLVKAYLNEDVQPSPIPSAEIVKRLAQAIGDNVVILHKGAADIIADSHNQRETITCSMAGSGRRCGGQGDLLAGSLTVFWWWAINAKFIEEKISPPMIAAYGACRLIRECNAACFVSKKRGMVASDMLDQVPIIFNKIFEPF